jgi:hypothetical protein
VLSVIDAPFHIAVRKPSIPPRSHHRAERLVVTELGADKPKTSA